MMRIVTAVAAIAAFATPALAQTTTTTTMDVATMTCADYAALTEADRTSALMDIQGYAGSMQAEGTNRGQAGASTGAAVASNAASEEDRARMVALEEACMNNDDMLVTDAARTSAAQ